MNAERFDAWPSPRVAQGIYLIALFAVTWFAIPWLRSTLGDMRSTFLVEARLRELPARLRERGEISYPLPESLEEATQLLKSAAVDDFRCSDALLQTVGYLDFLHFRLANHARAAKQSRNVLHLPGETVPGCETVPAGKKVRLARCS